MLARCEQAVILNVSRESAPKWSEPPTFQMPKISTFFGLNRAQTQLDFVDVNTDDDLPLFLDPYAFTQSNDGLTTLNPQFTFTGIWYTNGPGAIGATETAAYPRQDTNTINAYMTFKLDNTSAFFIYGLVNNNLGPFSATLTPPYELGPSVTTFYNSNAHWIGLDRVMYWASGMDRDKEYSVTITNLGQGNMPWWDFSHIDIIDAGSTSR